MAEAIIAGQLQLNIAPAPERVIVALGPLGIALTVEEARGVLAQLTAATAQVAAQLVIATPAALPPLDFRQNGRAH